uniref:Putative proton-dependent oligopeptide transporter family n=1 Tax=Helianthus annuus TaxID=4232 RepID=A0A251TLW6_HELAN
MMRVKAHHQISKEIQMIFESEASLDFQGNPDTNEIESSPSNLIGEIDTSLYFDAENEFSQYLQEIAHTPNMKRLISKAILLISPKQRFCVVGVLTILFTFMRGALHISSSESANIMTNCMGFLNILAIFGGFLGDVKRQLQCHRCICIYMYTCKFTLSNLKFLLLCIKIATS